MKTLLSLFGFLLLFASCEVEGELTKDQDISDIIINQAVLRYSGTFNPTSGISGSGTVKIYQHNQSYYLTFENYTIENGPDLKVYLSKTNTPNDYINLGAVNANSVYTIPTQFSFANYPYVLIHCQQYNHLFAIAALQEN